MAIIEKPMLGIGGDARKRPRDASLLDSVSRYTKFVFFSKMTLGVLSALMILTIIVLPLINADEEGLRLAFSTVREQDNALPMMTNPTFQGVDEKNQPYLVTADSALQHDEHTIILSNVQGDMLSDQQSWLSVKAAHGHIDNASKTMQLTDDVRMFHQDGFEFRTSYVDLDMQARIARGDKPVFGFGPMGEIRARGFHWDHDARILRFTGGVKMKVVPKDE